MFKKNIGEYDSLDLGRFEGEKGKEGEEGEEEEEEGEEGFNPMESDYSIPNLPYYLTNLTKEEQDRISKKNKIRLLKRFLREEQKTQHEEQQKNHGAIVDYLDKRRGRDKVGWESLFRNKTFFFGYKYQEYEEKKEGIKCYDRHDGR